MPAAIAKAMGSTVRIESWAYVSGGGFWGSGGAGAALVPTKVSSGSGVVYDAEERLILTNAHVLDSPVGMGGVATRVKVVFSGGQVREGRVVAVDRDCDIGLLRIEEPRWRLGAESERVELVEAPLGKSSALARGERVAVLGAPLGGSLGATVGTVESPAFLADEMAAGQRGPPPLLYTQLVRLAAPIVQGNSGGPVINRAGEVVAIASTAIQTGADPGSRKPLAISIEDADAVAKVLRSGAQVRRPVLGAALEAIDEVDSVWRLDAEAGDGAQADHSDVRAVAGLLVRGLASGGPAERAGLRVGDVIVRCNGRRTRLKGDVLRELGPVAQAGRRIHVQALRWGEGVEPTRVQASVELGQR
ncbi:hypothetical protein FNF27_05837 [Cafeteria roenbergensis]|nr:hypothetical protein FNF28_06350 [Cafeteria roenbergensis]KAA0172737.1 hypothetical protein FNF27_05837 [Cafeteria roenbergensis]